MLLETNGPALAKKLTVLHAVTFLVDAWNRVTQSTLVNCWQKSGLVSGPVRNEEVEEVVDAAILERLHMNEEDFDRWVASDNSLETSPSGSVEEIVEEVKSQFQEEEEESDDEEIEEVEMPTLSNSEALSAIESLKRFFLQKENSESDIKALDKMRSHVENQMFTVQPKIGDFFQQ